MGGPVVITGVSPLTRDDAESSAELSPRRAAYLTVPRLVDADIVPQNPFALWVVAA
jgi:hypothetical protein